MKTIYVFFLAILLVLLSWSCTEMDTPGPGDSFSDITDVKLLSPEEQASGAVKYKLLLPYLWEDLSQKWDGIGIQINDGEIQPLYAAQNQQAYYWEVTTANADFFIRFGHFRRLAAGGLEWANSGQLKKSAYYIQKNGKAYIGFTLRNFNISPVDKNTLTRLEALIDGPREVKVNKEVEFRGTRSTGQATPVSEIVEYFWEFGDGATASGPIVKYIYKNGGLYYVKLTVRDNLGNTDTESQSITVFKMPFPESNIEGGDEFIQAKEDRYNKTLTLYVNLSVTQGNHGRPFWWGTKFGAGTPWVFEDIKPVPLNEDWGYIILPFDGRQQYDFVYGDYYDYLDGQGNPVGVNWSDMTSSRLWTKKGSGYFSVLIANGKMQIVP